MLLVLFAVCGYWNLRAAASFAICVLLVRAIHYFGLNNPVLLRMVVYSVAAFVVLFFVDRIAGGFFAFVSASIILTMFGFMEMRTHVILSEVALVLGVVISAFSGPSTGLFTPVSADRRIHVSAIDQMPNQAHSQAQAADE
jgi:hypothetical protein